MLNRNRVHLIWSSINLLSMKTINRRTSPRFRGYRYFTFTVPMVFVSNHHYIPKKCFMWMRYHINQQKVASMLVQYLSWSFYKERLSAKKDQGSTQSFGLSTVSQFYYASVTNLVPSNTLWIAPTNCASCAAEFPAMFSSRQHKPSKTALISHWLPFIRGHSVLLKSVVTALLLESLDEHSNLQVSTMWSPMWLNETLTFWSNGSPRRGASAVTLPIRLWLRFRFTNTRNSSSPVAEWTPTKSPTKIHRQSLRLAGARLSINLDFICIICNKFRSDCRTSCKSQERTLPWVDRNWLWLRSKFWTHNNRSVNPTEHRPWLLKFRTPLDSYSSVSLLLSSVSCR